MLQELKNKVLRKRTKEDEELHNKKYYNLDRSPSEGSKI
jgi:hypothetical protein